MCSQKINFGEIATIYFFFSSNSNFGIPGFFSVSDSKISNRQFFLTIAIFLVISTYLITAAGFCSRQLVHDNQYESDQLRDKIGNTLVAQINQMIEKESIEANESEILKIVGMILDKFYDNNDKKTDELFQILNDPEKLKTNFHQAMIALKVRKNFLGMSGIPRNYLCVCYTRIP